MTVLKISLQVHHIHHLDLSPADAVLQPLVTDRAIADLAPQLTFDLHYPLAPDDPRELSEVPEIRLWFLRLDSRYPWLPGLLDGRRGELARYAAMVVPHQFSPTEGIQFNPEALEIFVMQKSFILLDWLQAQGRPATARVKAMAQILGYDLSDDLFALLENP